MERNRQHIGDGRRNCKGRKRRRCLGLRYDSAEFDVAMMDAFDAVAFGCSAMGAEALEEGEFAPMFEACETKLCGKKIGLFGSYGWGDGEWMRNWEETCISDSAVMPGECVICNEAPDDAVDACKALGKALT